MANININSKFNPFTYAELLAPVQAATTEHKEIEQGLAQLQTEGSIWERLAEDESNSESYGRYKSFNDDLEQKVQTLSRSGITPGARQGLYKSAQNYASKIIPVKEAYEKREEEIKAQQAVFNSGNPVVFDRVAANQSIDDYLDKPSRPYASLNLNNVADDASKLFLEAAQKNITEGNWGISMGGEQWQQTNKMGYTIEELNAVFNGDPNADQELVGIYNGLKESYKARGKWNEDTYEEIVNSINQGAMRATEVQTTQMKDRKAYLNPLQQQTYAYNAWKMSEEKRAAEALAENPPQDTPNNYWTPKGDLLTQDEDINVKELYKELELLEQAKETLSKGDALSEKGVIPEFLAGDVQTAPWTNPIVNDIPRKNPVYHAYEARRKSREDVSVDDLIAETKTDIRRKAYKARNYELKMATGKSVSDFVRTHYLSGLRAGQAPKIYKLNKSGDKGKQIGRDTGVELGKDSELTFSVNPVRNEVTIHSKNTGETYMLDTASLGNVELATSKGPVAFNTYMDELEQEYATSFDPYKLEHLVGADMSINAIGASLEAIFNSKIQNAPDSNAKASYFTPGASM